MNDRKQFFVVENIALTTQIRLKIGREHFLESRILAEIDNNTKLKVCFL
jgi:hypothetical protein